MAGPPILRRLRGDERGTAVIETAFVLPILLMLSLGAFEVSQMVARNTELRSALDETTAIALAQPPQDQAQVDRVEEIIEASTGLADENVSMARKFRCGTAPSLVDDENSCSSASAVARYLQVTLTDVFTPQWVSFGVGAPVHFSLTRTVQIG